MTGGAVVIQLNAAHVLAATLGRATCLRARVTLMAALVPLAVIAFAATNLDDLFVLLALFSDPKQRPRDVVVGQFLGMATLTVAAVACALAASSVPGLLRRPARLPAPADRPKPIGVPAR